jgi:hypothetical protein
MRSFAGIVLLSLLAAGCSGGSLNDIGGMILTGQANRPPAPAATAESEELECPTVVVREGTSTLSLYSTKDPSPLSLRYQGSIGRTARECKVVAKMVLMKIGVEGRIIVGPVGAPGKVDVPLRLAVVREGPLPATILNKTYTVPVTIEPGASNVPFVQVDDTVSFPMPAKVSDLEAYVVYIGYDPEALKKKAPPPRQRKAAPKKKKV